MTYSHCDASKFAKIVTHEHELPMHSVDGKVDKICSNIPLQIRTGVFLNVIGSVVSLFAMFTYTPSLFGLRQFPDWAVNVTAGSAPQH